MQGSNQTVFPVAAVDQYAFITCSRMIAVSEAEVRTHHRQATISVVITDWCTRLSRRANRSIDGNTRSRLSDTPILRLKRNKAVSI